MNSTTVPADVMFPDAYRCGQLEALLEIERRKTERLQHEIAALRRELAALDAERAGGAA